MTCRYNKVCQNYREDSAVCQKRGGKYCGIWRHFVELERKVKQKRKKRRKKS